MPVPAVGVHLSHFSLPVLPFPLSVPVLLLIRCSCLSPWPSRKELLYLYHVVAVFESLSSLLLSSRLLSPFSFASPLRFPSLLSHFSKLFHNDAVNAICLNDTELVPVTTVSFTSGRADGKSPRTKFDPRTLLYSCSNDKTIKVWSVAAKRALQSCTGSPAMINCLTVSANGLIFGGCADGQVRVWETNTMQCACE